jgi:anthranilate synthase component 1
VRRAKEYIAAGDVMQVVLSQRMKRPFTSSPLSLYRALRSLNPSPYMFYYDFEEYHVVGASPEILVRKEGRRRDAAADRRDASRGALRARPTRISPTSCSPIPKEIAEHVMLVDLGRNDVGRVAQTGTVKLSDRMVVERYSHVMHIVSNVEGTLRPGLTSIDVLRAAFPAGTVSGAPKVRAMEIIDELEPTGRGVYAGAVGYISFQDDMDTAIAIRTAVVKDGMVYAQAGAGIVHDSVPESEWTETENKARAIFRAADMVQQGLDTVE